MDSQRRAQSGINIRKSHPFLWLIVMACALSQVGPLGINFWLYTPAFKPKLLFFTPSNAAVGSVFIVIGVALLVFLNVWRDLRMFRLTLAVSVFLMFAWAVANTQQIFAGSASWQLPGALATLCAVEVASLIEAPVNPMTERR